VDSFKILPSKNYHKVLEVVIFSFAITFGELPKFKICQTNYPKLLELLLPIRFVFSRYIPSRGAPPIPVARRIFFLATAHLPRRCWSVPPEDRW
jgi:hypothetical protein